MHPVCASLWRNLEKGLRTSGPYGTEMMIPDQGPDGFHTPLPGEVFKNPAFAQVLRDIAVGGAEAFYKGRAGQAIVDVLQELGGVMTMEDLARHTTDFPEPVSINYHGVEVWEHPPNGCGITALIALKQLEKMGPEKLQHNSTEYLHLHLLLEVMRNAFADARTFIADQDKVHVPVKELLSEKYAAERRKCFDPARAVADPVHGSPTAYSDTVSFQVVDGEGNGVSFINSLFMGFGSCIVPKGVGFALQNRGGNFTLEEGHLNQLQGGKRPYHSIIPCMLTRDGELYATMTNMGGFMQPQGHVQHALNMVDFGMEPQRSIDMPRFCINVNTHTESGISLEDGVADEVIAALKAKGHDVRKVTGFGRSPTFGRAQIIRRNPQTGVLWAGSDGRADGMALGWRPPQRGRKEAREVQGFCGFLRGCAGGMTARGRGRRGMQVFFVGSGGWCSGGPMHADGGVICSRSAGTGCSG